MNGLTSFLWIGLQLMRIALAVMLAGWAINECAQGQSSDKWPSVTGKITASLIKEKTTSRGHHPEAEIKYQYMVDGKTYTSNHIQFGGETFRSASDLVAKYKSDSRIPIHYNPKNPSISCLESGVNQLAVIPAFAAALFFAFLSLKEDGKNRDSDSPLRSRKDFGSNSTGSSEGKSGKGMKGAAFPLLTIVVVFLLLKYAADAINLSNVHLGGVNLGAIPTNVVGIIVVMGGGLIFVLCIASLTPIVAMLMRAKNFKLAEKVAQLNCTLNSCMSPQSYETALALGLQAEIAQEQLQYEKALNLSKRALSVVIDRRMYAPRNAELSEKHKALKDHIVSYEKNNASMEALLNESLGCIYLDLGKNEKALEHANEAKRIAQDCLKSAVGHNREYAKLALACALTLKGKAENAMGLFDEASMDLQESINVRKQLVRQLEEYLAEAMAALAFTYSMQSETRKAERTIEEGLKLVTGSDKPALVLAKAKLQASLAEVKMATGHLVEAESLLNESLALRQKLQVPGHPEIARTLLSIAKLKELQGRNRDAAQHRETASEMLNVCFGKQLQTV